MTKSLQTMVLALLKRDLQYKKEPSTEKKKKKRCSSEVRLDDEITQTVASCEDCYVSR
jgi:hypothetical protein